MINFCFARFVCFREEDILPYYVVTTKFATIFTLRVILSETPPEIPLRLRLVLSGAPRKFDSAALAQRVHASLRMTRGGVQSKPKRSAGRPNHIVGADLAVG